MPGKVSWNQDLADEVQIVDEFSLADSLYAVSVFYHVGEVPFYGAETMRSLTRNLVTLSLLLVLAGCSASRPRPATAIREDADRLFHRGDYEHAVTYYRQVTERYPGDWEAQYRYGICQLENGNPFEARQALDIAHVRRPQHVGIVDALAESLFRMGDEQRLFTFLRERAESTQSVDAYLRLAKYMMESGDPDSARKALANALMLDNGQTVKPYLHAANFAQKLGDLDLAVIRLRQAYAINPFDEEVKASLRNLGEIPGPTIGLPPTASADALRIEQ